MKEIVTAADVVPELIESEHPRRLPVRNHEPREPMHGRKWHLIHERDGERCRECGDPTPRGTGEIDHIVPRSAFRPESIVVADRSDNLRLLCIACNQDKSNFCDDLEPRTVGVTGSCWSCLNPGRDSPQMKVPAYCGRCGHTWVPDTSWLL